MADLPDDAVGVGEVTVVAAERRYLRLLDQRRTRVDCVLNHRIHLGGRTNIVRERQSTDPRRAAVQAQVFREFLGVEQPKNETRSDLEKEDLTGNIEQRSPSEPALVESAGRINVGRCQGDEVYALVHAPILNHPDTIWLYRTTARAKAGHTVPLVNNAIYVDGQRTSTPDTLADTFELMRERHGMAWIGLFEPEIDEIHSVAAEFGLHRLVVEDAIDAHQRPKIERYGDQLFVVLRPARYVDETEKVEFGELHVFLGPQFIITSRHTEALELTSVRKRLEATPGLLKLGTQAVLYAIIDHIVDGYEPVVAGLQNDIDEIEDQLFSCDPSVSRRIYTLSREVTEFQRSTDPLVSIIEALQRGEGKYDVHIELHRNLRNVLDHCVRIAGRVEAFRVNLQNALSVNATLVAQQQNEEMRAMTQVSLDQNEQVKTISSWGAILFAPSLIAAIYGMNFGHMPELKWHLGYPLALLSMAICSCILYFVFKRQKWL